MRPVFLIRYAEIALKGKNRNYFERRLVDNIKEFLRQKSLEYESLVRKRGFFVLYSMDHDDNFLGIRDIFGISSISPAFETESDLISIKETVTKAIEDKIFSSFRITTKRSDKRVDLKSNDVDVEMGGYVAKKTGAKVSLKGYDLNIGIVIHDRSYVFTDIVKGIGGLPLGVEGRVLCVLDDNRSVDATLMMMKRGCDVVLCSRGEFDYAKIAKHYFKAGIKEPIFEKADSDEDIELLSERYGCKAIILAKSIEKTIKADKRFEDCLVLNPVIAY